MNKFINWLDPAMADPGRRTSSSRKTAPAAARVAAVRKLPADGPPAGARPLANGGPGLRELKKLDKRQRIRAAARELFSKLGYEAATLRQIARRAHVGLGTLFNYADDKRDLIFLIYNEELDAIAARATEAAQGGQDFVDQMAAFFRVYYRELGRELNLSRILLQELTFYSHGKQAAQFQNHRQRLVGRIETLVRAAQESGMLRSDKEPALIAQYIFFVYSTAIRWWIGRDNPDPDKGISELRKLFSLQVEGLARRPGG
jgi:AcrR family transcriptional regulator